MTTTIITANTWAYDDPAHEVVVPDWVKPFLAQAGYVHRDHLLRDQLAKIPAPVVVVIGDCE